jgi:hypothetical protein
MSSGYSRSSSPMRRRPVLVATVLLMAAVALGFVACGSADKRVGFDDSDAGDVPDGAQAPLFPDGTAACRGLECKQVTCPPGEKTSLVGKVYDPAGVAPLYNVVVYVPRDATSVLPPIPNSLTDGVRCERCASVALNPLVSTLTNTMGEFTLENVPVDARVPVVVQTGKWRRKFELDIKKSCSDNKVPDREFRLPKNGTEGDMPHVAVTTGAYDALSCLLRGIGIDESEFVLGANPSGHVHLFNGYTQYFDGTTATAVPGAPPAGGTASDLGGGQLWNDVEKLKKFDVTMLSCEGQEDYDAKGGENVAGARGAMRAYANAGGRVFATHYHNTWFKNSPSEDWRNAATWGGRAQEKDDHIYDIDTSFPKGRAFSEWLSNVGAAISPGKIQLRDETNSLATVKPPLQSWIRTVAPGKEPEVRYFSFTTPLGAAEENQCGRAVFSDVHVMRPNSRFPADCPMPGGLTAQQRAVEFLFFDLSACVQSDSVQPTPPK